MSLNQYLKSQKTKIWQDYSTSLELKKGEEMVFLCPWNGEGRGVYIVVVEKIWIEWHLVRVDKGSKRIMNLDPILVFRESWCIKFGGWWEWWASKTTKNLVFPVALVTARRAKFKKSYLTQFWSELSRSCTQIEALDI